MWSHMDVGVRELKRNLSEYLARAARGEHIRVTDRGRPKALLGPLLGGDAIARGVDEGWISEGDDAPPQPVERIEGRRRSGDTVQEDREGR